MADLTVDPAFLEQGDEDSHYGSDLESYATSLRTEVTNYKFVHGRRYHSYEEGRYAFPNDEQESDRLDAVHEMIRQALDDKLFTAPVSKPGRVLDIGTGTGVWAIQVGDQYSDAQVLGNDLSPIQPKWAPPNVSFEVDDVEKPWTYSQPFDLIHGRNLYGSIIDWPGLVGSCFKHTAPGGYCEFTDWDLEVRSPDNSLPKESSLVWYTNTLLELLKKSGKEPSPGPLLEGWVKEAGYEVVSAKKIPLPVGTWPADKKLKQIGMWNHMQITENLEAFATYMLTTALNWSKEEVTVLCAKVRTELKDKRMHAMFTLYNVVGKRPGK